MTDIGEIKRDGPAIDAGFSATERRRFRSSLPA